MSLEPGKFIVQYRNDSHQYGVISRKDRIEKGGWAFFEIIWSNGKSSIVRADGIKLCKDINDQIHDLFSLQKYQKFCIGASKIEGDEYGTE